MTRGTRRRPAVRRPAQGGPARGGRARAAVLVVGLLLLGLALSGCHKGGAATLGTTTTTTAAANGAPVTTAAQCPASNTVALAKTKFALHAGLAFGTFHRYVYKPFKAGGFSKGAKGRVGAFVKAGATALFDKREIRLAAVDVKANPTLCRAIAAPLAALAADFDGFAGRIGHGDTSGVDTANTAAAMVAATSAGDGAPITESTDESQG